MEIKPVKVLIPDRIVLISGIPLPAALTDIGQPLSDGRK